MPELGALASLGLGAPACAVVWMLWRLDRRLVRIETYLFNGREGGTE